VNVQSDEADIHCWEWDYPMEKRVRVILLSGAGPCRIRAILEARFECTYTRPMKHTAGRVEMFEHNGDTVYVIMLLSDWANSNKDIAVLAHEVNHLVFSHFKARGYHIPHVDCDGNDEELFNNQTEWWLCTMLEALNAPDKSAYLWKFNNEIHIP